MATRTYFATSGDLHVDLEKSYDPTKGQDFELGKRVSGNQNTEWVMVSAASAITGGDFVTFDEAFSATPLATAGGQDGHFIGVVVTAVSAGKNCFAAVNGKVQARAAANASLDKKLFVSDTAGVVDTSGASGISIIGAVLTTGGAATTALRGVILNHPKHTVASA